MDANQRRVAGNATVLDGHRLFAGAAFDPEDLELPKAGRQAGTSHHARSAVVVMPRHVNHDYSKC